MSAERMQKRQKVRLIPNAKRKPAGSTDRSKKFVWEDGDIKILDKIPEGSELWKQPDEQ